MLPKGPRRQDIQRLDFCAHEHTRGYFLLFRFCFFLPFPSCSAGLAFYGLQKQILSSFLNYLHSLPYTYCISRDCCQEQGHTACKATSICPSGLNEMLRYSCSICKAYYSQTRWLSLNRTPLRARIKETRISVTNFAIRKRQSLNFRKVCMNCLGVAN